MMRTGTLVQAGVNDFHTGVSQCARNHLGAAIMTIQTGFGNENTNAAIRHGK